MSNKYNLDRETYRAIKKMDRVQMEKILTDVYTSGKEDAEYGYIDLSELKAAIGQIKGIGKQLIDFVKCQYNNLTLDVFVKNTRAVDFYIREGFQIQRKSINYDTQEEEYTMCC